MYRNRWLLAFLLVITLATIHQTTSYQSTTGQLGAWCSNTTMFANNSAYQTNLKGLFHSLSSNATNNPSGFYRTTVGGPTREVIYGHYLCRGDQNRSMCHECVTNTTTTYLPKTNCPNRKVALIWTDFCMVRYSNVSFFDQLDMNPLPNYYRVGSRPGNATSFFDILHNMMNNVIAVQASGGGPYEKFAAHIANSSLLFDPILYGYGQCTPDLASYDCYQCLTLLIQEFVSNSLGGIYIFPSCIIRYEIYPFLDPTYKLELPQPPQPSPAPSSARDLNPIIMPSGSNGENQVSTKEVVSIVAPLLAFSLTVFSICIYLLIKKGTKGTVVIDRQISNQNFTIESLQYDLATLKNATNNFSDENKLGEGGFGGVYKGTLSNGELIAVKRLSPGSSQGIQEFKTEVLLVAKLEHKNLVRLLGFCYTRQEKLLVYEHVANKSLDNFLFNHENRRLLNWRIRYNIIRGVARGLLYLHHVSQHRIIHRDLKASNILLDDEMNPKISDFGTSRILGVDNQSQSNYTSRVVGTYGYMSPEYALHGQFSIKSDAYSFGVLVLEIISGNRNSIGNQPGEAEDLLSYDDINIVQVSIYLHQSFEAWKQWAAGTLSNCVDPMIRDSCSNNSELMRCIHLGLLCIQEAAERRPTMANVVLTLDSYSITLPRPEQPNFPVRARIESIVSEEVGSNHSSNQPTSLSVNDVSITELEPR